VPRENEKKYVIDLEFEEALPYCLTFEDGKIDGPHCIRQGYLVSDKQDYPTSLRVRETVQVNQTKPLYELCFKRDIGGEVVEIEKRIIWKDFEALWETTTSRVRKDRYKLCYKDSVWDIDFFLDSNNETYFILAEYELLEYELTPEEIPSIIHSYLLHELDPGLETGFGSKDLADIVYAKQKYLEIIGAKV